MHQCGPAANPIEVDDDVRIVIVRGGRFAIDRVPACALTFSARWRDRVVSAQAVIEPGRTSFVELDIGKPREKAISGVVRDADGSTIANARVTALVDNQEVETVRSDAHGAFSLKTRSGAQLVAGTATHVGRASVGRANVTSERVEIRLTPRATGAP